jgi:hypothetical protein
MGGIFICYRREDTAGWAGRLQSDLQEGLEGVVIFRDIDAIPPGVKFDEHIAQAVGSCDVLIAMIGPHWLTASDRQGARRLDDPDDFIRLEISTCLQRNIRVIPALVGGAAIPAEDDLPDSIRELARRQAYELSESRWAADCHRLIAALAPLVQPRAKVRRQLVAALAATLVLALGGYALWQWYSGTSSTDGVPADITTADAADTTTGPVAEPRIVESGGGANAVVPVGGAAAVSDASGAPVTYVASGAGGAGVFEFAWPGGDCWDIFRGDEKVAYGCGSGKQALGAGTYTIKNASAVFLPFDVEVRPGFAARVVLGGVFEFKWPGGDCWDVYRGDEKITYGCGPGKQALQPGRYAIRNANSLFLPFTVDIKPGVTTAAAMGGVFEFKWPGGDCWDVYRGDQKITYGCGAGKQALQAGRYTIKASSGAIFVPFDITVRDGATVSAP